MSDESQRLNEMYLIEEEYYAQGITLVAGCDEAGRGPLAGPVVAAAVILPPHCEIPYLNDSKKLTEKKRFALEPVIKENAVAWAVARIEHDEIDAINNSTAGDMNLVTETEQLLHFAERGSMMAEFDDMLFEKFVDRIWVDARNQISFVLKCGLTLRERIGD